MKKAARVTFAALLCLVVALPSTGEPLVAHARQLEKAHDVEGAARLLSAWLGMNPGASGSAAVFDSYLRIEQDLAGLLEESRRFLQSGRGVPGVAAQFEKIARIFDLAGRTEEARDAYLAAHDEGAPDSSLVSAFILSLRMNDTAMMSSCIQKMSAKGESTELLLQALAHVRAGESAAARAQLTGLADQTGNPDVALKALWSLYEAARESGDSAGQAAAREKLAHRFAAAPETALAAGQSGAGSGGRVTVVRMPAPALEAGSTTALPAQSAQQTSPAGQAGPAASPPTQAPPAVLKTPAEQPSLPASPLMSVQAGSFVMKENADDLVTELSRRGFEPAVIHESVQGKDRYRVLAASGLPVDAAKGVLKRLSDAGFQGFLVQEK